MNPYEKIFIVNLKEGIKRQTDLGVLIFGGDNNSHKIVVSVYDGANPAALTGTIVGKIIRPDGATVEVQGAISGNTAYIILPEAVGIYPGPLDVTIKNISGDNKITIGSFTATAKRTETGTIVDPGDVIPNVDDLLALVDETTAAKNAANTAAEAAEHVNVSQTKSGETITITTTDRNNVSTSNTVTDPVARLYLLSEYVPGTTQEITFGADGNVQAITHKSGNTAIRTDAFTFGDGTIAETRTLNSGEKLIIVTDLSTLETATTYTP